MNYYNEIEPYAAQWMRNLIAARLIPNGVVDERSIEDVTPGDLAGFTQVHFFAGIAGWSLALRLAGIPDNFPIWTGSCPCQPFSTAGEGAGFADERHLWPAMHWLIRQCNPELVVGEQVASKDADPWIDLVQADMEALGFAFGAVAFPSASIGAPHIRDRTYWMADRNDARLEGRRQSERQRVAQRLAGPSGVVGGLANFYGDGRIKIALPELRDFEHHVESCRPTVGLEHAGSDRPKVAILIPSAGIAPVAVGQADGPGSCGTLDGPGPANGVWRNADWIGCRDGKWRPVESGTFPLAHGVSNRVGRCRAYGNAINPHQAAEFLKAGLL